MWTFPQAQQGPSGAYLSVIRAINKFNITMVFAMQKRTKMQVDRPENLEALSAFKSQFCEHAFAFACASGQGGGCELLCMLGTTMKT